MSSRHVSRFYYDMVTLVLSLAIGASSASAADYYFDNGDTNNSDWGSAANWGLSSNPTNDVEPTAADNAYIGGSFTAAVTQAGEEVFALYVGQPNAFPGPGSLIIEETNATLTADIIRLGSGAQDGLLHLVTGSLLISNTVDQAIYVGNEAGARGHLIIGSPGGDDSLTKMTFDGGRFHVGQSNFSEGHFTLHSGSITGSDNILIGANGVDSASYATINGGTLFTTGNLNFNHGTGSFIQTGGTVEFNTLNMCNNAANTCTITLNGGSMKVNGAFTDRLGGSVFNLGGSGILDLADATEARLVEHFSMSSNAVLRMGIVNTGTGVLAPLNILTQGTFSGTPTIEITTTNLPGNVSMTGKLVTWTGGADVWDEDGSKWDANSTPADVSEISQGQTFTVVTSPNAMTNPGVVGSGTPGWSVSSPDAYTIEITRTGASFGSNGVAVANIDDPASLVTRDEELNIFQEPGADAARLDVSAGSLTLSGTNELALGCNSNVTGNVIQDGGLVELMDDLRYGTLELRKGGAYHLNAGTLHVHGDAVETTSSVANANLLLNGGTLIVDGSVHIQRFAVGHATGSDAVYTSAVPIRTTGTFAVGGLTGSQGEFVLTSTNYPVNVDVAKIGQEGTARGTLRIESGIFNVTGGEMQIGGKDDVSANTVGHVIIGTSGGGSPAVSVTGGHTEVGQGGTGTLDIHGGIYKQLSNNVVLGQGAGGIAVVNMHGGLLDVLNDININRGSGEFNLHGGTVVVRDVRLGATNGDFPNQAAAFTHAGGTLLLKRNLRVGEDTTGTFHHVSGDLSISNGHLYVGGEVGTVDRFRANGTYNLGSAGSEATLTLLGGNLEVGRSRGARGVFNHTNGTVSITGYNLVIGQHASASYISHGTYNLTDPDGMLTTVRTTGNGNVNFNNGIGVFNQQTGTVVIVGGGMLNLTAGGRGNSTYNLNGGAVRIEGGNVDYRNNGTNNVINLNGGTLDVGGGLFHYGNRSGSNEFNFTAGVFRHVGTFNGNLRQQGGRLVVGDGPGVMAVAAAATQLMDGDYSLDSAGTLEIELDGFAGAGVTNGHDMLVVPGTVNLDADAAGGGLLDLRVNLELTGEDVGKSVVIIDNSLGAEPVSGTFANGPQFAVGPYVFKIDYTAGDGNDVALELVSVPSTGTILLLR